MVNYGNSSRSGGNLPPEIRFIRDLWTQRRRTILLAIGVLFAVMTLNSVFYTAQPSEEVVVLRFGKYNRTTDPGLNFKLPFGIEEETKVTTKLVLQDEFGFRTQGMHDKGPTQYADKAYDVESRMLTGDLNVADVEWIVQYQISDPRKYLFQAAEPHQNIRDISEAIMRRVVGDRQVNEVLTTGRVEIGAQAQKLTQEVLDKYDIGVRIVTIKLQDVNPPQGVRASFNEVNAAKQEQEQAINQAEEAYNKIIPEARGKAEETVSDAEGYASALVNRAHGDAERFGFTLEAYRRAPDITRKRMYLDAMQDLFGRFTNLTIIDDKVKGVLPVLGSLGNLSGDIDTQAQGATR